MNVYEIITDRFITMLQTGTVPWRKPWSVNGASGMPKNLISGKEYRGVNVFLLASQPYGSPYWVTYKQAASKGGNVRKGEKGTPVIFWKITKDEKNEKKRGFILRYYTVFNVEQCDGLKVPAVDAPTRTVEPIQACDDLVKLYKDIPHIDHGGDRAAYNPSFDRIVMPRRDAFNSAEEYYSTYFHELVHSTGHTDRLNRDGITNPIRFGSHDYSFEELVAECGSAFLSARAGISPAVIENQAAYIAHWCKVLKSEPRWIIDAASKGAKAVEYMCGAASADSDDDTEEEPARAA